jgi:hypothetical protein
MGNHRTGHIAQAAGRAAQPGDHVMQLVAHLEDTYSLSEAGQMNSDVPRRHIQHPCQARPLRSSCKLIQGSAPQGAGPTHEVVNVAVVGHRLVAAAGPMHMPRLLLSQRHQRTLQTTTNGSVRPTVTHCICVTSRCRHGSPAMQHLAVLKCNRSDVPAAARASTVCAG